MQDGAKAGDGKATRPGRRQMDIFLDALAESSNVAASARAAGVSGNAMYRERRRNPGFAARWHAALCEGFARLEAELLSEALIAPSGNVKDATLKSRAQKYRLGLALLAAHRAAVRGGGVKASATDLRQRGARERLRTKMLALHERIVGDDGAADFGDASE